MMVHGIYLKNRPKSKWHLVSVAVSQEIASQDSQSTLDKAKLAGNDFAQVAIQSFESGFYIPEYLTEVKEQKPMYN